MYKLNLISNLNVIFILLLSIVLIGCAASGREVRQEPIDKALAGISGVGIESQDIDKITKLMVDEILALNLISNDFAIPRIIIDSRKIINESSQVINTSLLTDRMRIALLRQAKGKLLFISRENSDAVIEEAKLAGTLELFPADYRLVGKITSLSSFSDETGIKSNFIQVAFEMLDLKTSALIWGNLYQVKKVGADDTIYR